MPDQDQDDYEVPEPESTESFAYADYSGVVLMIQTYYYKMLELYRQYYLAAIKGKDHRPTRQQIQSYIVTLSQLLKRYSSVKSDDKADKFLKKLDLFTKTLETMKFEKLKESVDIISDAHSALGLTNIEFNKRDPSKSIKGGH